MFKRILTTLLLATLCVSLISCSSHSRSRSYAQGQPQTEAQRVWANVVQASSKRLYNARKKTADDPIKTGWIDLALIAKIKSRNTQSLVREILAWREQYPNHPGNELLPPNKELNQLLAQPTPKQIAVLLPQTGKYSSISKTVRSGILNAYYKNSSANQRIKFYDTGKQNLKVAYTKAVKDGADVIIGPLTKDQVNALVSKVTVHKPTLALNYTTPGYYGLPNNLYEFGLKPEDEIAQITNRARSSGLSKALLIAPESKWGKRFASVFLQQWQQAGGKLVDTMYFKPDTDFTKAIPKLLKVDVAFDKSLMRKENDKDILSSQRRQDFDVIFLFTKAAKAHTIVPMLRYYYTGKTPIFATSSIYGGNPNASRNVDLNGVIVCDIPSQIRHGRVKKGMPSKRLFAVGRDAYTLSQNLDRMNKLQNFPIYGATGALVMSNSKQIHRRIPCTPIRNVV